ncbi:hypothetical protein BS78_03G034900 [Paspalum vaginatum]|nr:hypothetical protein BS78_03G034900 [Paspalum vaginatum]
MGIPNMLRAALDRMITASIPSTASYGFFTRVLSFTSSFNDRTSLLLDAEAELGPAQVQEQELDPPPQAREEASLSSSTSATASVHALDIEQGGGRGCDADATAPLRSAPDDGVQSTEDAESKRVAKSVQTVCLFAASASMVLFVNLPSSSRGPSNKAGAAASAPAPGEGGHDAMYSADLAFIALGFFSSLSLSMFSIAARPGEPAVARLQKWGMMVAVASVMMAFSLRMGMMMLVA